MDIDDEGEQEGDRNHDDPNNEGFIGDEQVFFSPSTEDGFRLAQGVYPLFPTLFPYGEWCLGFFFWFLLIVQLYAG